MTAAAQQLNNAEQFAELWKTLIPEIEAPPRSQFLIWAGAYSDELVTRGINRAGAKSRKERQTGQTMTAEACARYASSVMHNESRGIVRHEPGKTENDTRR